MYFYQAIFASRPFGHFLTTNLLPSSKINRPSPKPAGMNQNSTGTRAVRSTRWNGSGYNQKKAMTKAKSMAGKR